MYRYGYDCGLGGWHFIIPIIIVGLIIYAVYRLLNDSSRNNSTALEELNRKFINGELTEEQYHDKKAIILKK